MCCNVFFIYYLLLITFHSYCWIHLFISHICGIFKPSVLLFFCFFFLPFFWMPEFINWSRRSVCIFHDSGAEKCLRGAEHTAFIFRTVPMQAEESGEDFFVFVFTLPCTITQPCGSVCVFSFSADGIRSPLKAWVVRRMCGVVMGRLCFCPNQSKAARGTHITLLIMMS